ncbi:MAG: hypothetical protein LBU67_02130 [Oscillospiraceae bacterium]|nr:hypothetical protein [Oscillospiraceae bacterium]
MGGPGAKARASFAGINPVAWGGYGAGYGQATALAGGAGLAAIRVWYTTPNTPGGIG